MSDVLSQNQLISLMNLLKESLAFFDSQCYKVAFLNEWCMYRHICDFRIPGRQIRANIGALLDVLEPYIPFRISEDNFDLFMESIPQFTHKAKLDFVVFLRDIRNPEEWERTLAVCEAIRAVKEELAI